MLGPPLTVTAFDQSNGATWSWTLFTSPALVGRGHINSVHLFGSSVSRYHGAFVFGIRLLQYVDFGSTNGTKVDGVAVEADVAVDLIDRSVIEIGPFRITIGLRMIEEGAVARPEDPRQSAGLQSSRRPESSAAVLRLIPPESTGPFIPSDRHAKAAELLADLLLQLRSRHPDCGYPPWLGSVATPAEVVSYLSEPSAPERIGELRASLTAMFDGSKCVDTREGSS
jgi:hypothetical protein